MLEKPAAFLLLKYLLASKSDRSFQDVFAMSLRRVIRNLNFTIDMGPRNLPSPALGKGGSNFVQ
jgi:hypothetical protein